MTVRLPAEWEPQDAVLVAWPHEESDWQPCIEEVEPVFIRLTREISRFEKVVLVVANSEDVLRKLQSAEIDMERVRLHQIPTNDTWFRDFGPLTVLKNDRPELLDFTFNGWGLKFSADQDNQVTRRLHQKGVFGDTPLKSCGLTLEGGSVESDGRGTLLTTSQCLLSANRNPHMNRQQIEESLCQLFGSRQVLWLENGYLAGDDTDAHIDTLARLCPDDTIVYVRCDNPDDEHYDALQAMAEELQALRTLDGKPFRLIPLPWPQPCFDERGHRLPATYANFLVINGAVLVPTYGDMQDAHALSAVGQAFPNRAIIGVNCLPLIKQHGSLHCVTMQLPKGVLP
ncbi:agmatine deiminase, putative [Syntrophotalea carbinolica DSM 2380]|uniref:Agmatine deiminase, putative n=1 Tax=Syntrophotalea carbinolica (strain DSM 2380 / NBRC 103641 / GraBd1) TaxID=338963 RepID=Q3A5T9_SYNC1|nr:agmatine deiminase family protein [Syntrophotalea carbinolica]ABA88268.1 agmatine deiminase, putative [Syntrophotalea carbinolica DSM 2380]